VSCTRDHQVGNADTYETCMERELHAFWSRSSYWNCRAWCARSVVFPPFLLCSRIPYFPYQAV